MKSYSQLLGSLFAQPKEQLERIYEGLIATNDKKRARVLKYVIDNKK